MTPHPDDGNAGGEESLEQLRGKFPDYANRKVSSLLSVLLHSSFWLPGRITCFFYIGDLQFHFLGDFHLVHVSLL
jgi:hypothetical protein